MKNVRRSRSLSIFRWARTGFSTLLWSSALTLSVGCQGAPNESQGGAAVGGEGGPDLELTPQQEEAPIQPAAVEQTVQIEATGCPDSIERIQDGV